jgi:flagellar protein FlaG
MPAYQPAKQNAGPAQEAAPAAPAKPAPKPVEQSTTSEAVKAAAEQIASFLKDSTRELEFRLDEGSGQMVVTVRDATTGDVIRQIPGEEVLRLARVLKEGSALLADVMV